MSIKNNDMAIEDQVLSAIKEGRAKMRPKAYFAFRNAVTLLAGVIIILVFIYLVGFIIFAGWNSNLPYGPAFGATGWQAFFISFPWIVLLLIAVFLILIAVLARRYPFGYRWPIIYSLVAIILLAITINILLAQTSLYGTLFESPLGIMNSGMKNILP